MWESFYQTINSTELTPAAAMFRLLVSLILGAAVGIERKRRGQMAGMRTFALIAMGATLAMVLSIYIPQEYLSLKNGDPGRIAAQVISGIGFLGAGAIIQMKGSVRGLTTAAGIWMVATIGMAVGVGMYAIAICATLLVLFVLTLLERMEHHIHIGTESKTITVKTDEIINDMTPYRGILRKHNAMLNNYFVDYNYVDKTTRLNLVVLIKDDTDLIKLISDIGNVSGTLSVSLMNQPT